MTVVFGQFPANFRFSGALVMMPLKRYVAKETYLIALLRNKARIFLCQGPGSLQLNFGHCRFLPLDGAAVILYSHLVISSFPDKFESD